MSKKGLGASPYSLIKYFFIALSSITFFVLLKASSGSWFEGGFIFAFDNFLAFIIFIIILFSYYKFGVEAWRLRLYVVDRIPQFMANMIGFLLVITSVYFLSEFSMVFSLYIVGALGLDPLQGYIP